MSYPRRARPYTFQSKSNRLFEKGSALGQAGQPGVFLAAMAWGTLFSFPAPDAGPAEAAHWLHDAVLRAALPLSELHSRCGMMCSRKPIVP